MESPEKTAVEAGQVLDALAALSADLACHCDVPPHTIILPASKVREACDAIDEAVAALKRILDIAHESGHGPIPPDTLNELDRDPKK
jgi:hypothetical protein